jgi:DNA-binding transcriptional regulator YdaS (Cro superfamily)
MLDPIAMLLSRLNGRTAASLAKEIGISEPLLSQVLSGKRRVGPKILRYLNLERRIVTQVTYRRIKTQFAGRKKPAATPETAVSA